MKNEATDLSRIGLNIIRNNICPPVWKLVTLKSEEWLQNRVQVSVLLRE
jgi:hypothetical protein